MKIRVFLVLIAVMATASFASAQNHDKRMAQIKQAYADRLEIMNNNPYEGQMFNQVNVDLAQNMPGSGMREVHDRYYFTQEQYSADGSMDSQVYFATSTITYAMGAHKWYWEFLWDSMEGDPMFALLVREEPGAKQEYRFYFENLNQLRTNKFKIETWDAGWYQIRMALKNADLAANKILELKELHRALRAKLLPQLTEYGII